MSSFMTLNAFRNFFLKRYYGNVDRARWFNNAQLFYCSLPEKPDNK